MSGEKFKQAGIWFLYCIVGVIVLYFSNSTFSRMVDQRIFPKTPEQISAQFSDYCNQSCQPRRGCVNDKQKNRICVCASEATPQECPAN